MRALLKPGLLPADDHAEAESILRACVHCGFCNATCPSYQVLGDERDGPRGRIYLMKSLLEGTAVGTTTQAHLDRCLGCRACESTCPSGVQYARLLELVRPEVERAVPRHGIDRTVRWLLRRIIPSRTWFGALLALGRAVRTIVPAALRRWIPARVAPRFEARPVAAPRARLALFEGCVQESAAPQINRAAEYVLSVLDIATTRVPAAGCCGALALHLGATDEAQDCARRNVDAWLPLLDRGEIEGIFSASTGCTQVLKDYGHLLRHDVGYAARAARVARAVRDAGEIVEADAIARHCHRKPSAAAPVVAFQAPCSLQHGLRGQGAIEETLRAAGYRLSPVAEAHLCCGSAGTYSLLQPVIAGELRARKLAALTQGAPQCVASANVGCQLHLQQVSQVPVSHWLELVAEALSEPT